jgi:hypothetical protein
VADGACFVSAKTKNAPKPTIPELDAASRAELKAIESRPAELVPDGPAVPEFASLLCVDCAGSGKRLPGGDVCDTCYGRRAVKVRIAELHELAPYKAPEKKK